MDSIGGRNVMYYSREDIRNALIGKPVLLNDKKFMELFAGYLVAYMLNEEADLDLMVGFPLKAITRNPGPVGGPSLLELLDAPELIDDSDVDICIGDKQEPKLWCQVTRVVVSGSENRPTKGFIDVLKAKLRVEPDDGLSLIINIEDEISIDRDELKGFLSRNKVPYGDIYIVGKSGNNAGKFKCWRIYPDSRVSNEFDIQVPL